MFCALYSQQRLLCIIDQKKNGQTESLTEKKIELKNAQLITQLWVRMGEGMRIQYSLVRHGEIFWKGPLFSKASMLTYQFSKRSKWHLTPITKHNYELQPISIATKTIQPKETQRFLQTGNIWASYQIFNNLKIIVLPSYNIIYQEIGSSSISETTELHPEWKFMITEEIQI